MIYDISELAWSGSLLNNFRCKFITSRRSGSGGTLTHRIPHSRIWLRRGTKIRSGVTRTMLTQIYYASCIGRTIALIKWIKTRCGHSRAFSLRFLLCPSVLLRTRNFELTYTSGGFVFSRTFLLQVKTMHGHHWFLAHS